MLNHFAFWSAEAHSYLQFPSQVGSNGLFTALTFIGNAIYKSFT